MIVMIDGCMISRFVNDSEAFNKCANDRFQILDADGDGALSFTDLQQRFNWFFALDSEAEDQQDVDDCNKNWKVSDSIFKTFDTDQSNTIDREEFRPMLMEMMLAVARGIGNTPVNVAVEEDGNSLVAKAYEYELERIEREEEEKRRKEKNQNAKMKEERSSKIEHGDDERGGGNSNVNGNMKLKKKKSSKILGLCACSGKYLGDHN